MCLSDPPQCACAPVTVKRLIRDREQSCHSVIENYKKLVPLDNRSLQSASEPDSPQAQLRKHNASVWRGGALVESMSFDRRVVGSNPALPPHRDLGQVLPVALRHVTPTQCQLLWSGALLKG